METAAKILVVDDDEDNLTLIRVILQRHGYETLLARSGEEALRQVLQDPPDLIVLDVMMPGIDGIEVCRQLKDDEDTRLIPIVIMTALDQPEDKIRGIEAGADDFLTKPVNQPELLARVRTALRLKRAIDRKMGALLRIKDHLAKFVPLPVRQVIEARPEAPALDPYEEEVSVLFVDVSGYTRLSLKLDYDRVNAIVERDFSHFLDCVHEQSGYITGTAGDGMMVVFQGDDSAELARRTARAALRILEVTERLHGEPPAAEEPIAVHLGLNSGRALVGSTRFEGLQGTLWTFTAGGPMTNLAARLGAAAAPGTILIRPETAARIGGSFDLEPLGPRLFKNLEVVAVSRLLGEKRGASSSP